MGRQLGLRLRLWWWSAFWALPVLGLLLGLGLVSLTGLADDALYGELQRSVFSATASATVFAAIGGGMITFTGFVFSFVLLILQFGSSQYSPRTVSYFLGARLTQAILAVFLATVAFSFSALIYVGVDGREDYSGDASVLVAMMLLMLSLIGFVTLLHTTGSRVRVDRVLTAFGRAAVERLPHRFLTPPNPRVQTQRPPPPGPDPEKLRSLRYQGDSGQLVALDTAALMRLARRHGSYLRMRVRVGDAVAHGATVAVTMSARGEHTARFERAISRCLVVAVERSLRHDPLYALRLLVDVAIRALSAAVNDPTTAVRALDEIERVLRAAAPLPLGPVAYIKGPGTLELQPPSWKDCCDLAWTEIIECGSDQPQVTRRLTAMFEDLLADLPADRQAAIAEFDCALRRSACRNFDAESLSGALVPDRQGLGGSRY
ncbi:MAG: DUF2254 domain-containing protein [Microlunatus sp.]|nr:DUF2254 domain-containing protein [Microlunatus sp.]